MKFFYTLIAIAFLSVSGKGQDTSPNAHQSQLHKVVVEEMVQTKVYTYLLVKEESEERWLAAPRMEPVIGAVYYYLGEMEMKNFNSKELDRTFESVTFVEDLVFEEIYLGGKYPIEGGTTIADLFIYKNDYDGKIVKVRGKVTKFNEAIMGKNWIHLNDGTNVLGNRDFIVTSKTNVKVGDVVTFQGTLSKHVDLGHGYLFEVLMEDGEVLK